MRSGEGGRGKEVNDECRSTNDELGVVKSGVLTFFQGPPQPKEKPLHLAHSEVVAWVVDVIAGVIKGFLFNAWLEWRTFGTMRRMLFPVSLVSLFDQTEVDLCDRLRSWVIGNQWVDPFIGLSPAASSSSILSIVSL